MFNVQTVSVVISPMPVLSSSYCHLQFVVEMYSAIRQRVLHLVSPSPGPGGRGRYQQSCCRGVGNPMETLINTSGAAIPVTYLYTLAGSGCVNTQSVVVTVNPLPTLSSSLTPPAVCNNTNFSYAPTSANGIVTGWSRAAVAGISNAPASGAGNPNETLINTTTAPINVTYVYSLSELVQQYTECRCLCQSDAFLTSLNSSYVCSRTIFNYTPTSTTAGAVFDWSRQGSRYQQSSRSRNRRSGRDFDQYHSVSCCCNLCLHGKYQRMCKSFHLLCSCQYQSNCHSDQHFSTIASL